MLIDIDATILFSSFFIVWIYHVLISPLCKLKLRPPLVPLFSLSIHQTVLLLFWKNWTWNKYNSHHRFIFHSLLNPTPIKMLLPFISLNTKSLGISVHSYYLAALNIINQTSFINTLLLAYLFTYFHIFLFTLQVFSSQLYKVYL